MSLTFTSLTLSLEAANDGPDGTTGRHPAARLDRLGGSGLHRVLAGGPCPSHLPDGRSSDGREQFGAWCRRSRGGRHGSSGNVAFDEYREETLRKLDEEQREFRDFLDRLRAAKDRAEFDDFMAERRSRPPAPRPSDVPPATPPTA